MNAKAAKVKRNKNRYNTKNNDDDNNNSNDNNLGIFSQFCKSCTMQLKERRK